MHTRLLFARSLYSFIWICIYLFSSIFISIHVHVSFIYIHVFIRTSSIFIWLHPCLFLSIYKSLLHTYTPFVYTFFIFIYMYIYSCIFLSIHVHILFTYKTCTHVSTGWRRLRGSPELQIIFHKRANKYRSLLRKMSYKDNGPYESSPPCKRRLNSQRDLSLWTYIYMCTYHCGHTYMCIHICVYVYTSTYIYMYIYSS